MRVNASWAAVALAAVALLGGNAFAGETEPKVAALPRLLEVGAKTCIPCQQMAPIIAELKQELAGKLEIEFIDVSVAANVARAQQLKVESIPTQIYLAPDGKELWRHVGFLAKADLLAKWRELGYEFAPAAKAPASAPAPATKEPQLAPPASP